jgi:putative peptidoglycan lipid II flippase
LILKKPQRHTPTSSSVRLLFQRGAFGLADTAATAEVMRLYSLGLVGQVLIVVGALVHFSRRGATWVPATAAAAALVVIVALDVSL